GLHGNLIVLGVQARTRPLRGPAALEVPAHDLLAVLVEPEERSLGANDLAFHGVEDSVPEGEVSDDSALERDVLKLLPPGQPAHGDCPGPGAVLDRRHLDLESGDLGEGPFDREAVIADAGDEDLEVVCGIRIGTKNWRHDVLRERVYRRMARATDSPAITAPWHPASSAGS